MAKEYQGFEVKHTTELVNQNDQIVNSNCMSLNFFNRGETPVTIRVGNSLTLYTLLMGQSLDFPIHQNSNPLIELSDSFKVDFAGEEEKALIVTKAYAIPKVLFFN